ncbi:GTP cyclohydrolase I, partial [Acinetobacter baumannii]|uniref:GTP cyclohydrolase I n=1 Tax=Acinetobacter baumannii TaxID=470 RepID=UPI001D171A1E
RPCLFSSSIVHAYMPRMARNALQPLADRWITFLMMRGVEKQNSSMVTSVMLGQFRDNAATRSEFLGLVK